MDETQHKIKVGTLLYFDNHIGTVVDIYHSRTTVMWDNGRTMVCEMSLAEVFRQDLEKRLKNG